MSCRAAMENLAKEIYLYKQREQEMQEHEDLVNFWLGTCGRKPIRKPNLTQICLNTIEPYVGKEFAKKFEQMMKEKH